MTMSTARPRSGALPAFLLCLTTSALVPDMAAAQHQIVGQSSTPIPLPVGELLLTDTTIQVGPDALNRFTMHRLRRPNVPHRGALLLLPALGNRFAMYLFHESGDVTLSFAAFFARIGYDVWGYSPRTSGIAAGACGGGLDCSAALGWNLQTIVDDATYVRARIEAASPGRRPVVGGLSLGAMAAIAVVDAAPTDYAGLLAWEGSLSTEDPAIRAHTLAFYGQLDALLQAGVPVEDQSLPFVKLVAQLAQAAPDDPFAVPVPGFPPGLTNRQALVFVLTAPNPIAPSPRPGFTTAAGDFATGQLFYSDLNRLLANIAVFDDVTSNGVARDLYGSLAGVVTTYTDDLASFTAPALVIEAGLGFGPIMDELPGLLGSTDVVVLLRGQYGHVDHLGSPTHWLVLELEIARWLSRHVFP